MDGTALELEKSKFNALLSAIREGVFLLDPNQHIIGANDKALELTGYKLSEVLSKPANEVIYIIDSTDSVIDPNLYCPIGGLDLDGVIYKAANVSLVNKNDMVKVVNIQSRKIKEGSKIDLGAILIIDDVFEQADLERMKEDFVSMAVHMLRTPLTVVKGFLASLSKLDTVKKLTESEMENLTMAIAGAGELDILVENLLHLSEIQNGQFKLQGTLVSYEGLVAQVVADFKAVADAKNIRLLFVPPLYDLPQVKIDIIRIKEVLRNLLDNAIKYTDAGGVEISISKDNTSIITTIKDTGKGIPQAHLEYIFTKFYRIKDPLEMERGLGLGLFISKKVIEAHGGKIWAESIEGQGSAFHFTIPLNRN